MSEAGLHAVHAGLHGDFSLRLVLPVLLVTQQEEATQLLAPRRQQGCKTQGRAHVSPAATQRNARTKTHTHAHRHTIHTNSTLAADSSGNIMLDAACKSCPRKKHLLGFTQPALLAPACRGRPNSINTQRFSFAVAAAPPPSATSSRTGAELFSSCREGRGRGGTCSIGAERRKC